MVKLYQFRTRCRSSSRSKPKPRPDGWSAGRRRRNHGLPPRAARRHRLPHKAGCARSSDPWSAKTRRLPPPWHLATAHRFLRAGFHEGSRSRRMSQDRLVPTLRRILDRFGVRVFLCSLEPRNVILYRETVLPAKSNGAGERIRTPDQRFTKPLLYLLSYAGAAPILLLAGTLRTTSLGGATTARGRRRPIRGYAARPAVTPPPATERIPRFTVRLGTHRRRFGPARGDDRARRGSARRVPARPRSAPGEADTSRR